MQAKGTLVDQDLRSLLEEAQSERATGTLTVRDGGDQPTTLYFLFGHLFHAMGEGAAGDEAVVSALGRRSGEYDFDAKAKLPADETVKSSIPELLERAGGPAEAGAGPGPAPAPPPPGVEWPAELAPPPVEPPSAPRQWATNPSPEAVPQAPYGPAPEAFAAPEPPPPAMPPEPVTAPAPVVTADQPRRGVKHRPSPTHGREPIPVPAGQVIYDSLKTSFVDFPRLITTLEREQYTGYVRLLTDAASGLIFFRDGQALECVYDIGDDPAVELGKNALAAFNDEVTRGSGVLDVVGLSSELVDGLFELTVAQPIYTELYASWVDMNALLAFLEARHLSGSLMVRAAAGTGVIILNQGRLAGAYTSDSREISDSAAGVLALCADPAAMIEVTAAADTPHEPLDVDGVVGNRRSPAPPPPGVPPPPVPAPAPPLAGPPVETAPGPASSAPPAPVPAPAPAAWEPPGQDPRTPAIPTPSASFESQPRPLAERLPISAATSTISPAATAGAGADLDWEVVILDLQQMTEEALGNRSRKVKDVLGGAERSPAGLENAIGQVPTISILFVDSSRLEALANDLRAKLNSYLR